MPPPHPDEQTAAAVASQPPHANEQPRHRLLTCHQCDERFPDRVSWYEHWAGRHAQVGQGGLHVDPYNDHNAPWIRPDGVDEALRHVYRVNRPIILERYREGNIESVYNFPVDNTVTVEQLMYFANQVFSRQTTAFKLNINFGYILRNRETREVRYFRPFEHEGLLDLPIFISSRRDLHRLERFLNHMGLQEMLLRQRQDTKWVVELLTNVRFSVYKTRYLLGNPVSLPQYIKNNKSMYSLASDRRTGKAFDDNLCAFRCLALHQGYDLKNLEPACSKNYERWVREREPKLPFQGLMVKEDLPAFEDCFGVNVEVFSLDEEGLAKAVYSSLGRHPTTMRLNLSGNHLSYIHKFDLYSKKYPCQFCDKIFQSSFSCKRHSSNCEKKDKFIFPGGFLSPPKFMFHHLAEADIDYEHDHYPWFITYDFEAIQPKVQIPDDSKLQYQRKHIPVSVSVCSNVPDYLESKCFVSRDPDQLITDMLTYMEQIQNAAHALACERWERELAAINFHLELLNQKQRADEETTYEENLQCLRGEKININKYTKEDEARKSQLSSLLVKLEHYLYQIPVLGFCSSRYDINLVRERLLLHLKLHQVEPECEFIVKKCNSYVCISNEKFKFLDMAQFLAPNSSYSSFLKAFNVQEDKGFFPYEWFDDYSKLDYTSLPDRESFFNSFKNEELSGSDYDQCLRVWREYNMATFKDFLIWYNNLDVKPFVTAVERWQQLYFDDGIDVFKTAISLPGIARQKLFQYARRNGAQFSLIDKKNADLHDLFKQNLYGGPSIIYNRHAEKGVTKIRGGKLCQKVLGYDCNSLYLYALDQNLPHGIFVRRKAETGFKPEVRDIYIKAFAWLDYMIDATGGFIRHFRNTGSEKKIANRFPVDGYDEANKRVFQFHGCYTHGHLCEATKNVKDAEWHASREERYERTNQTTKFIKEQGFEVVEIWECQFRDLCKAHPALYCKIDEQRPAFQRKHKGSVTEKQILDGVRSGVLFGFVQVDICVPEQWPTELENPPALSPKEYFSEQSPIFCTSEIPFEAFGEHMQNYVEEMGLGKQPRVLLVGGMAAEEILIATPLLQWYLKHGLEVKKVHQVVEYQRRRCFEGLADTISAARRAGDTNPDSKIMAETNKTIGNACYGCLCMDKSRHTCVRYFKGDINASQAVNEPQFRKLTCLNEEEQFYEVVFAKDSIKLDVPIQIAVFILNLAKLRMLQFHYDWLDRLVSRDDYMLLEMDTDSSYMALSEPTFEEAVRPEMKEVYLKALRDITKCKENGPHPLQYMMRFCCPKHQLWDKRQPGCFKEEFRGDEMIGLCSKTYFVEDRELQTSKLSCKGVNKKLVENPKEIFKNVLLRKRPEIVENRGIRAKGTSMYTYKQSKVGFNYFYVKRKVSEDSVSTSPLDIVLKPAKRLKQAQIIDQLSQDVF